MAETATEHDPDFYDRLKRRFTSPLWLDLPPNEPRVREVAHVWRWTELESDLGVATEITPVGSEDAERRVLSLRNPSRLERGLIGTTNTLGAAVQRLMPGEAAPAHRHTFAALRYVIQGSGATTIVNGRPVPMASGDLVLTPGSAWHDHVHAGDEPIIWMDGLDAPFVVSLGAGFFEEYPGGVAQPVMEGDGVAQAFGSTTLLPADHGAVHDFPVLRYPWEEAYGAVKRLEAEEAGAGRDGYVVEYVHPGTGGHVLPTIACYLQLLPAGSAIASRRSTTSSVNLVMRGRGRVTVGEEVFQLGLHDIVAIPTWSWHHVEADPGEELVLFRMTDRAQVEPFGLYREEWR